MPKFREGEKNVYMSFALPESQKTELEKMAGDLGMVQGDIIRQATCMVLGLYRDGLIRKESVENDN